jgi:hypothetical protein
MNPRPMLTTVVAILMALALAACAAPAPATPDPAQPTPVQPTPVQPPPDPVQPTPDPVQPPPDPVQPTPDQPPIGNGDEVLLGMFPQTIAGQPLSMEAFTLAEIIGEIEQDPEETARLMTFLGTIGRTADQVSIAFGAIMIDDEFVQISAFRAPGVPTSQLLAALTVVAQQDLEDDIADAPIVVLQQTVGGKQVNVVQVQDAFEDDERDYLYGVGDVVIAVETTPEVAEIVFAELP